MFRSLIHNFMIPVNKLTATNTVSGSFNNVVNRGYAVAKRKLVKKQFFVMRPNMKSKYKGNPRPRVKMILLEDVEKLGLKGTIVEAKRGVVHYQLLPNKLAEYATEENLKKHGLALDDIGKKVNIPINVMNFLKKHQINMVAPDSDDIHEKTRDNWVITRHDIAEYFHRFSGLQVPINCMEIKNQSCNEIREIGEYTVLITLNKLMTIPVPMTIVSRDVLSDEID